MACQLQEVVAGVNFCSNPLHKPDPLARQVVVWRFGLADSVPARLEEVATRLRLSEIAVQRIEAAALGTLRTLLSGHCGPDAPC